MTNKVYMITGANRGMGFSITTLLSADSNNVILATTRDPFKSEALNALAANANGTVHVVTLDVSSQDSINGLDAQLSKYAPDGIDYFISNAGISREDTVNNILDTTREAFLDHYIVNALGPLMIAKVVKPYLDNRSTRVFYFVSTAMATMSMVFPIASSAYPQSKIALNHSIRRMALELKDEGYTVVAVHPGFVMTEMGKLAFKFPKTPSMEEALKTAITPEESAECQLKLLAKLTKNDSGKFFSYTSDEMSW